MNGPPIAEAEQVLRALASGDASMLQSVLAPGPWGTRRPSPLSGMGILPPDTARLVHLAALLAVGGSTTSLRWAVERALVTGARDEEIVEVLTVVAPAVGSARVVAAAPRLALAIGYDIEVEGWDGY